MLELIREHPVMGLVLALGLEAWLALPGEVMIAVAASSAMAKAVSLARLMAGGMAGMMCNDLVLFGVSRAGRGVLASWLGRRALHLHLSTQAVLGAKFVPPLRPAAFVLYGLEGTPLAHFLWISLLSSALWVSVYAAVGCRYEGAIQRWMMKAEPRRRWMTVIETGATLGLLAAIWL